MTRIPPIRFRLNHPPHTDLRSAIRACRGTLELSPPVWQFWRPTLSGEPFRQSPFNLFVRDALTTVQFGKALVYLELEIKLFYHVIHSNIIGHGPHKFNDLLFGARHDHPLVSVCLEAIRVSRESASIEAYLHDILPSTGVKQLNGAPCIATKRVMDGDQPL